MVPDYLIGTVAAVSQKDAQEFTKSLVSVGWRTPDSYSKSYDPATRGPALYFFSTFDLDSHRCEVAYVGQSKRLSALWASHQILPIIEAAFEDRGFVRRWFRPCRHTDLRKHESYLIREIDPSFNIIGRKRGFQ